MSAAVWKNGAIVWSESLGQADLEDGAPVSSRTRFRIGSLSKLLTTAAAARLYEQGLLDLDAPIQQYVPAFPAKSEKITARLLLVTSAVCAIIVQPNTSTTSAMRRSLKP
jgi:serine beta-lactamase-like protein LACTB